MKRLNKLFEFGAPVIGAAATIACLSAFGSAPVLAATDSGTYADSAPVFEQPEAGTPNLTGQMDEHQDGRPSADRQRR